VRITVKILILEPSPNIEDVLRDDLNLAGIEFQVRQVAHVSEFSQQLFHFKPDLILARHAPPDCDATAALLLAHQDCADVPFILLCPSEEAQAALRSLPVEATDYALTDQPGRISFAVRRVLRELQERKDQMRAHAALLEMEERYRAIFDRSLDCLYIHDFEGNFLDANPAALALLGYERHEIPAVGFRTLLSEDQLPKAMQCLDDVLINGRLKKAEEFSVKHKNGRLIDVELKAALIMREGKPFAVQGIARDISDRKRAESELKKNQDAMRRSEARFRRLVNETGQVVYDYDLATSQVEWDGATLEVMGYTWEEMQAIGHKEWEQLIHPEDRAQTLAQLDQAIAGRQRYRVEYRFRHKNGDYVYVDEHGSFLTDVSGDSVRMLGSISDITERRNTEDRIREQARLLDLAHDAIFVRNLDDTIIYWNESAERLYGWTAEEALGRNVDKLLHHLPAEAAKVKAAVLAKEDWNDELSQTTRQGERLLVETRLTLVRDRQGNPSSILSINSDVTARKKLEAQLLRSQRMESIGTLASGIAHDLNNVLAPILMSCQLLVETASENERKQWLEIIRRNAQRGGDLVKQVLSFCRGAEGRRMELQVKSVIGEVNQIVHQTFPKSITVRTRLAQELWTVLADPTQLYQVLLNLCVNARDAMPDGGVLTIGAENVLLDPQTAHGDGESRPRPHLMIEVADTGTGIPTEFLEKIFDPFFTTKEMGKGTGLGLSTSLSIVKNHGGFINVYSEPDGGSVFKVFLPALSTATEDDLKTVHAQLPRGHGELVLLVDDEAAVRTITARTLQTYGYNVITACDGAEAIEMHTLHAREVAVILTDMMMPVMDGPTTIKTLFRRDPNVKIIAASGLSSEGHMAEVPSEAVKAFLPKPYTAEALLSTVHKVLTGTRIARPDAEPLG